MVPEHTFGCKRTHQPGTGLHRLHRLHRHGVSTSQARFATPRPTGQTAPPGQDEGRGYEWTAFDQIQPEDEGFWRWYFADVPLQELRRRRGLDAGCGKGRYSRFTAGHLASLVALDGSRAVEAAKRNLADLDNVAVVRADVRAMPFGPETFGFVSCLGVLYVSLVIPGRWVRSLPLGIYRNQPVRSLWLDTFDRLSAPLENR
jgi:SAM-dependent methyltransferase